MSATMRIVLIKKENKDIANLNDDEVFEITKRASGPDAFQLRYRTANYNTNFHLQKSDHMTADDVKTWFSHLCNMILLDEQPYALMQCDFLLMPPTLIPISKLKEQQFEVEEALEFGLDFISDDPVDVWPKQADLCPEKPKEMASSACAEEFLLPRFSGKSEAVKFTNFENFTITRDVPAEDDETVIIKSTPGVIQHIRRDVDQETDWWAQDEPEDWGQEEEEYEVRGHSSEARYHQIHYRTGEDVDSSETDDAETVSDASSSTSDEEYLPPQSPLRVNYRGVELNLNRRPIQVHIPESRRHLHHNSHLFFDSNGNVIPRHCMTTRSGVRR